MELLTPTSFLLLSAGLVASMAALSRPIFGLVLLVVVAVAIDYASHDLILMGIADALVLVMLALAILQEKRHTLPGDRVRAKTPVDGHFGFLAVLAVTYLVIGAVRQHDVVFMLGDFYHVLLEMCLPFFLCAIFLKSERSINRFVRTLAISMLVLSIVVLLLYVTGILQQLEGAGGYYRHSAMWRIRINSNYPFLPLVLLLGVWFSQRPGEGRWLTGLASVALLIVLILTLKRTLWIAFALVLVFYFFSIGARQRLLIVRTFVTVVFAFIILSILLPERMLAPPQEITTYTRSIERRFSQESDLDLSVENRIAQFSDAGEVIAKNPLGYGLGYEPMVRFIARSARQPTHYVHNAFIHYQIQMGLGFTLFFIALSVKIAASGARTLRLLPDGILRGTLLGSLGCYTGILIASLTEIAVNSFFLPFAAANVFLIERIARKRSMTRADQDAEPTSASDRSDATTGP